MNQKIVKSVLSNLEMRRSLGTLGQLSEGLKLTQGTLKQKRRYFWILTRFGQFWTSW